ncbi:MAG TPA: hypothetical protein VGF45_03805 [Polyangia bacterium]
MTAPRFWNLRLVCAILLPLATIACGAEGDNPADLEQTQKELRSDSYSWSKGQAPVDMGVSFGRTCFLTRVSGDFEGLGESVKAEVVTGRWKLSGTTGLPGGISAKARCVYLFPTAWASWSKGQARVSAQTGGACFLTRVAGQFNGGGESVGLVKDASNRWTLGGSSQAPGSISASAVCVANEGHSINTAWARATWLIPIRWDGWEAQPTNVCGLQGMKGAFEGLGESITVAFESYNSEPTWTFRGISGVSGASYMIGGTAGCISD